MALRVIHNSPEDRFRMMKILHEKVIEEERHLPIPPELARSNAEFEKHEIIIFGHVHFGNSVTQDFQIIKRISFLQYILFSQFLFRKFYNPLNLK